MAAKPLSLPANRAFNANGVAIPGATAEIFTTGTLTPRIFYSSAALSVSLGSKITANGIGQFPAAYQDETIPFRIILRDAHGATLDGGDIDPYYFGTMTGAVSGPAGTLSLGSVTTGAPGSSASASNSGSSTAAVINLTIPRGDVGATGATGDVGSTGPAGDVAHAADRTALAAIVGQSAGATRYLVESGREGLFVWDSSNLSTLVTADPQQGIYVAPASAPTGASGAWVRKFSGKANVLWWGAIADDATNTLSAIQAAIDTLKALKMTPTEYGYGFGSLGLFVPARQKAYYMTGQVVVDHTLVIEFDGGAGPAGGSAVWRVPDGVGAIKFTANAVGSIFERPMLYGGYSTTESESHGIELWCKMAVVEPKIYNFPGDGIHGEPTANTNDTVIIRPFIQNCRDNIYFEGSNANALKIDAPENFLARRWGLRFKDTIGESVITAGDYSTNGYDSLRPTMCTYSGHWYSVLPGQETWVQTNAPTGTTADNQGWHHLGTGVAAGERPTWTTGHTYWRAGGVMYLSGGSNYNTVLGGYQEGDGPPAVAEGHCAFFNFGAILPDGTPYGGYISGDTSHIMVPRQMTVGDVATPSDSRGVLSYGDVTLSYLGTEDRTLLLNTGNNYSTINFAKLGTVYANIQYDHGASIVTYLLLGNRTHRFYANGVNAFSVDGTGASVTGVLAATGTVSGSNLNTSGLPTSIAALSVVGNATNASAAGTAIVAASDGQVMLRSGTTLAFGTVATAGLTDASVTLAKQANVATASVFYRKTAGSGAPEVQTLATLKTDLGLTGTNSGDQISIVGITGTIAQFNTAITDADIVPTGLVTASGLTMTTGKLLGRSTAATGAVEELSTVPAANFPILTGDVTTAGGALATTIATNIVTDAKLRQGTALTVIGRSANSTGNVADIAGTNNQVLRVSGSVLGFGAIDVSTSQITGILAAASFPALTGDVTTSSGAVATTIANNAVTYAKFNQVAASSLVGNATGSLANATGITLAGGLGFSGSTLTAAGALTPTSVASTGAVTSSSATAGIGYATGAGGAVTQLTSKSTAPPAINKVCGQITMNNAALAAAAKVTFTVSNTSCAATDGPYVWVVSGGTANAYRASVTAVGASSFSVTVENITAGSLSEAPVIGFFINIAVTS